MNEIMTPCTNKEIPEFLKAKFSDSCEVKN